MDKEKKVELPEIIDPVPMDERETTIAFYKDDELAEVFTSDSTVVTKLNKMVEKHPEVYLWRQNVRKGSVFYTFPKELIRFASPPSKQKREQGKRLAQSIQEEVEE